MDNVMRKSETIETEHGSLVVFVEIELNNKIVTRYKHPPSDDGIPIQGYPINVYQHKVTSGYGCTVLHSIFTEGVLNTVKQAEEKFILAKIHALSLLACNKSLDELVTDFGYK
jgi:hypothetical protein